MNNTFEKSESISDKTKSLLAAMSRRKWILALVQSFQNFLSCDHEHENIW
jgi:hypothetical protein